MTPARVHFRPRRHGFTLLELVLVMVLICAALAAATPSLRGFLTASRSRDAATQVLALTRYARAQAASQARIYRLNFDAGAGAYWLEVEDGPGFVHTGTDFGQVFSLPPGMQVEITTPAAGLAGWINFYPDGRVDPATVMLTDAAGDATIIASPSPAESFRIVSSSAGGAG